MPFGSSLENNGRRELPPALAGFSAIQRYWDRDGEHVLVRLKPGEYYISLRDEILTTTLGSCIAACIHDRRLGIGGMNHFMLPQYVEGGQGSWEVTDTTEANRYGNYAMENLINGLLAQGGRKEDLDIKLFGGGRVMKLDLDVSDRNAAFALAYVRAEKLRLVSSDLGGDRPRTVKFFPKTGKVFIKRLNEQLPDIMQTESRYMQDIQKKPLLGDLEFF